jgi:hypothetical protein
VSLRLTSPQKEQQATPQLIGSLSVATLLQIPPIFLEPFFHGFPDGERNVPSPVRSAPALGCGMIGRHGTKVCHDNLAR